MSGVYYIIGDVRDGKTHGSIQRSLPALVGKQTFRHILYIGTATANGGFQTYKATTGLKHSFPTAQVVSLATELEDKKRSLTKDFEKADMILFEGGNVERLLAFMKKFEIKRLCQDAFDRGAAVGGICGGGAVFAGHLIHSAQHDVEPFNFLTPLESNLRPEKGLGLMPQISVSCSMDIPETERGRLEFLKYRAEDGDISVGLKLDEAVIWTEDCGLKALETSKKSNKLPFRVMPDGRCVTIDLHP